MSGIGKPFTRDMAFTETKGGSSPNPVMLTGLTDDPGCKVTETH